MPSNETTASQIQYRRYHIAERRATLRDHPEGQIEAIAKHYLYSVAAAKTLLKILEHLPYCEPGSENERTARECAKILADGLRESHAMDLGLELDWGKPDEAEQSGILTPFEPFRT
jgi:hypothetical protein